MIYRDGERVRLLDRVALDEESSGIVVGISDEQSYLPYVKHAARSPSPGCALVRSDSGELCWRPHHGQDLVFVERTDIDDGAALDWHKPGDISTKPPIPPPLNHYYSGQAIEVGDRVRMSATATGRVIAVISNGQFSQAAPEEEWAHLGHGFLVEPGLYWYEEADEDLELIDRAGVLYG
ncbi:hypothetical protein KPL74_00395 [Bacillus sp. NP157]|nr:hypothetical protein KPL74_00395 [Bacillus sp. NP157]